MPSSDLPSRAKALTGNLAPPVLAIMLVVMVWALAAGNGLLPRTVPAPLAVLDAFFANWDDLQYHMMATLRSAVLGFFCALLAAATLGGMAAAVKSAERPVFTFGVLVDSTPLIAIAPILMIWLGNGLTLHVVVAAVGALFPLLVGTVQGLKSADTNTQELFHVLSASRLQKLFKLMLPNALPYLFAAMKVAAPSR